MSLSIYDAREATNGHVKSERYIGYSNCKPKKLMFPTVPGPFLNPFQFAIGVRSTYVNFNLKSSK